MKSAVCNICFKNFNNPKSMTNHRRHHDKEFSRKWESKIRPFRPLPPGGWNKNKYKSFQTAAIHLWANKFIPMPKICRKCRSDKFIDAANISGKYLRDISDWNWLCRKCHMTEDGRIFKFYEGRHSLLNQQ